MRRFARSYTLATLVLATLSLGCESSVGPNDGRAAAILLESGGAQGANVGSTLAVAPVVKVVDRGGDPVEGVTVSFAVGSGGGSITGGTAETDENGLAAIGSWTLGSVGENQLTASVAGLQAITISAVGRCAAGTTIAINTITSGELTSTDCRYAGGELTDRYSITIPAQRAVRFTQTSTAVNSFLELQGPGNVIAFNGTAATTDSASFKVLLAPGTFDINPSTYANGQEGGYSISAAAVPENEEGCDIVFAVPGITTDQTLAQSDCQSGSFRYDAIGIYLHTGRTYTFTMTSLAFDAYLELLEYGSERVVAENDNISATNRNARITITPEFSTFYLLAVSHRVATGTGAYTLTIEAR